MVKDIDDLALQVIGGHGDLRHGFVEVRVEVVARLGGLDGQALILEYLGEFLMDEYHTFREAIIFGGPVKIIQDGDECCQNVTSGGAHQFHALAGCVALEIFKVREQVQVFGTAFFELLLKCRQFIAFCRGLSAIFWRFDIFTIWYVLVIILHNSTILVGKPQLLCPYPQNVKVSALVEFFAQHFVELLAAQVYAHDDPIGIEQKRGWYALNIVKPGGVAAEILGLHAVVFPK
jgi:hypothetical protein